MAWLNDEVRAKHPWKITIAEDLQGDPALVAPDRPRAARASVPSGTTASSTASGRRSSSSDDEDRDVEAVARAIIGERRGAPLTRVIYTESHDDVANGQVRVPESITPGRRRQLVGEEAHGARVGARADVARHPDAVHGPGAARGPLVRRHDRARLGEGGVERRDPPASTRTSSRCAGHGTARRGACAGRTCASSGRTTRRRCSSCTAGATAARTTTPWSSPTSRTARSTTCGSGFPAPGRWNVRLNSDSAVYDPAFGSHEVFDLDADGEPMDGCDQSGLVVGGAVQRGRAVARGLTPVRSGRATPSATRTARGTARPCPSGRRRARGSRRRPS